MSAGNEDGTHNGPGFLDLLIYIIIGLAVAAGFAIAFGVFAMVKIYLAIIGIVSA